VSTMAIVVDGLLRPDGTLELDAPPRFPPGRVRVTLQLLTEGQPARERLPDPPWPDSSIPTPFDLPRPDSPERVRPQPVAERLPEPVAWTAENAG
jgi:hypothetical protein